MAVCTRTLPENCGHSPSDGSKAGAPTLPIEIPGALLAALARLGPELEANPVHRSSLAPFGRATDQTVGVSPQNSSTILATA